MWKCSENNPSRSNQAIYLKTNSKDQKTSKHSISQEIYFESLRKSEKVV